MNYPKYKAYEGAPEGHKRCSKCGKMRSLDDFKERNDAPDGLRYDCNYCIENRGKKQVSKTLEDRKKKRLKKNYNMTVLEWEQIFEKQKGKCAICGTHHDELKRGLYVDHNHKTNKVRALLCGNCNRGLGEFKEDIQNLRAAIKYIKKYNGKE